MKKTAQNILLNHLFDKIIIGVIMLKENKIIINIRRNLDGQNGFESISQSIQLTEITIEDENLDLAAQKVANSILENIQTNYSKLKFEHYKGQVLSTITHSVAPLTELANNAISNQIQYLVKSQCTQKDELADLILKYLNS